MKKISLTILIMFLMITTVIGKNVTLPSHIDKYIKDNHVVNKFKVRSQPGEGETLYEVSFKDAKDGSFVSIIGNDSIIYDIDIEYKKFNVDELPAPIRAKLVNAEVTKVIKLINHRKNLEYYDITFADEKYIRNNLYNQKGEIEEVYNVYNKKLIKIVNTTSKIVIAAAALLFGF